LQKRKTDAEKKNEDEEEEGVEEEEKWKETSGDETRKVERNIWRRNKES